MMRTFRMNGQLWYAVRVEPSSSALVDRRGVRTVATTDPQSRLVCLSSALGGDELARVAVHEAAHAAMVSFGLVDEVRRWARPEAQVDAEEWCCNFLADYGAAVFGAASEIAGP